MVSACPSRPSSRRSRAGPLCGSPVRRQAFLIADGCTLSYLDLDLRSTQLALSLLAHGIGKGDHVGILMPNSTDWALAWFATTRIGAVAVPLNTFYKAQELGWTTRHADLKAILAWSAFRNHDFLDRLEEALPGLAEQRRPGQLLLRSAPFLRSIVIWAPATGIGRPGCPTKTRARAGHQFPHCRGGRGGHPGRRRHRHLHLGGSTGDPPKAPVHSHGALVRHTYNLTFLYKVTTDDVMFTAMPFFWVGGLITGLHAVIHHGGATLVTQPAFDAAEALTLMEKYRATIALGWPQQGKTLAEHPDFATRDLSSVQRTSMPAMVPPDRRPQGPNSLGMTELCGNHVGVDPYVWQPAERSETGGWSIEGLHHQLVEPETQTPVAVDTTGEIWVRGLFVDATAVQARAGTRFHAGRVLPDR